MDEELNVFTTNPEAEEVISYTEDDIRWFRCHSIVSKSLVTRKVKNSLKKWSKSFKIDIKYEMKENDYLITICGQNRDKVIESKMKFKQLIDSVRRQRPFTHLITVPFNGMPLRQEFTHFRDNVLTDFGHCRGIDESLFQKPFKLHMTFCVLVLDNQNDISLAKQVLSESLEQIVRPILEDKPLSVSIEGLDCMKGSPERAHVVYAKINDESNRLQSIADQMVGLFVKSGLLEDNQNKVKLHITFMNSLFRQRLLEKSRHSLNESKRRVKRDSFDAKTIIESFNSYKFCQTFVESIQLNDIKSTSSDGFYGLVDSIDLNARQSKDN